VRAVVEFWPLDPATNVTCRDDLLIEAASPAGQRAILAEASLLNAADDEEMAPLEGLRITDHVVTSSPDGNLIKARVIRLDDDVVRPCVYYLHGGGMAMLSSYFGNYQCWARIMAHRGVVVVLLDYRNSVVASSVPEVAPFPAGLNDCVSGLYWIHDHVDDFGIDPTRIVVAGESGGGNLTLAVGLTLARRKESERVSGLYALCPYINGSWPDERYPSSVEFNGYMLELFSNRGAMAYGIEAFNERNPLAWPGFATHDDVRGFAPTTISVNECDPLRDEGLAFADLLRRAKVPVRTRVVAGTTHATELYPPLCPEITLATAEDIVAFAS